MIRVYEIRRSRAGPHGRDELHTTWKIDFGDRLTRRQMAIALLKARVEMIARHKDWKETGVLKPWVRRALEFDIGENEMSD